MKTSVFLAATATLVCAAPVFAQNVKLTTTPLPDGTGTIGLASGWKLGGAYNGSVQCIGPNGAAIAMKVPWAILDPNSSVAGLPAGSQVAMASPGDIGTALREVLKKNGNATLKKVRGNRLKDVSPGAPAYLLFYEYTQGGKTYTAIGFFAALVYENSPSWQLYSSAIVAPKAVFPKMVKTMIAMWRSWHPNGQKPIEGSSSAIFDKIMKEKRESYDDIQQAFRVQL